MLAAELASSPHVQKVRSFVRDRMSRLKNPAPDFSLADLAYGWGRGPSGCDFSYVVEIGDTTKEVGYIASARGYKKDFVIGYCLVQLANGQTIELAQMTDNNRPCTLFSSLNEDNESANIYFCGEKIGECVLASYRRMPLGLSYPDKWLLIHHGRIFGEIVRGHTVDAKGLFITRPGGVRLPLMLGRIVKFKDSTLALWDMISFRFLYANPRPNRNLVIPTEARHYLHDDEFALYFAISALFRTIYFQFDFPSGSGG